MTVERRFQITWIRLTNEEEPWHAISELGGVDQSGNAWQMTPRDLIDQLWLGHTAFVRIAHNDVDVIVVREKLNAFFALEDGRPLYSVVSSA